MKMKCILFAIVGLACSAGGAVVSNARPDLAVTHPISERKGSHENLDWFEFRGFHYTDEKKDLPRVLLIGDSISGGYRSGVQERLEGMANVSWFTACYCVTTPNFMLLLDLYLDDADYAVIHINNGLHSFGADSRAYETKLGEALRLIKRKQPTAKIVWARSTPVADEGRNRRVEELNAIADRVAKEADVDGTDDLYAAMMSVPADRRWSDGCHPKPDARRALVTSVARSILPHLGVAPSVTPTKDQLERLEEGIMATVHFGLNAVSDKKRGYGDTSPSVFNPAKLETNQWAEALSAAGIRHIVTATNSAVCAGNEAGCAPIAVNYVTKRGCWETPECCTPLRKGWLWREKDGPKSLSHLVDVYFSSVGRGCVLNLGIAPNNEGLVGADDVRRLREFGDYIKKFNAVDLAEGATVWRFPGIYQIDLPAPTPVNAVDVKEDLTFGQKASAWKFEYDRDGVWTTAIESATIGYRRIERFAEVTSRRFRVVVTESDPGVYIDSVALRHVDEVPVK